MPPQPMTPNPAYQKSEASSSNTYFNSATKALQEMDLEGESKTSELDAKFTIWLKTLQEEVRTLSKAQELDKSGTARELLCSWAANVEGDAGTIELSFIKLLDGLSDAQRLNLLAWRMLQHKLHDLYGSWSLALLLLQQQELFQTNKVPHSLEVMQWVAEYKKLKGTLNLSHHRGLTTQGTSKPSARHQSKSFKDRA